MKTLLIGLAALLLAGSASAQTSGTCNGFINLTYPTLQDPAPPACTSTDPGQHCVFDAVSGNCDCCIDSGQTVTVSAAFGAGNILNGTVLDLAALGFDADCQPFTVPICAPRAGGPRVEWVGNATITTTCAATIFATAVPNNTNLFTPGTVIFPVAPILAIPKNTSTPPGLCKMTFDERIIADPGDSIFQLIRYEVGACDNGNLVSGGRQTAKIEVCPAVGPIIGYQIKRQGVTAVTGGSMDIPILGIFGAPVPDPERVTARRLLTPAKPNNIFGEHILGFSEFLLPLPNPRPTLQVTAPGLGTFTAQLGGRSLVLINAVKDLNVQPPAQPLTSVWACYNFTKSTKQAISWEDQFGPNTGKTKSTTRVCLPASLLGSTPPPITYLCANNFPDNTHVFPPFVFVGSAWLSDKETLDSVDDYCVPATVVVQ